MRLAVDNKSLEAVLAMAQSLSQYNRLNDALNFLIQSERSMKDEGARFRLRLEQLRYLALDPAWQPQRGRAQIAGLFRMGSRERSYLTEMVTWMKAQAAGPHTLAWIEALRTEARSGADRPAASLALCCLAEHLPQGALPDELVATWKGVADKDRICLELAADTLLSVHRPAWAWAACQAARDVPSARMQGRMLPVAARVAQALGDGAAVQDLFAEVVRMPFPGGSQTVDWALAFEQAGQPGLAGELFEAAIERLRSTGGQQGELFEAWCRFLIRQGEYDRTEAALVRGSSMVVQEAAQLVFELYHAWGRLDRLDQELPKFHLPGGIEKEVRFLATQAGATSTTP